MKKAQSGDGAFLPSRTTIILPVSGASNEALPTLEGFSLQLTPSFKVRHNRNSLESDSLHESTSVIGDLNQFGKVAPLDFSYSRPGTTTSPTIMKIPSVDSGEGGGSTGTTLAGPTLPRPGKGAEGKENIASAPQTINPS